MDLKILRKREQLLNKSKQKEFVNHPAHYQSENGKECIDLMIEELGVLGVIYFCLGNAFKYQFRAGKKEGNPKEQDIAKGEWYTNKAKELLNSYMTGHFDKK